MGRSRIGSSILSVRGDVGGYRSDLDFTQKPQAVELQMRPRSMKVATFCFGGTPWLAKSKPLIISNLVYLLVMGDFTDLTPARQQLLAGMIAARAQSGSRSIKR